MFGLFYTIAVGLGFAVEKGAEAIISQKEREEARQKGKLTYRDDNNKLRLVETNERVADTTLMNGDHVLKYDGCNRGRIIRNYTQEKYEYELERNRREAIRKGKSTYCITVLGVPKANHTRSRLIDDNGNYIDNTNRLGYRFKDFKTGDVYVIRKIRDRYYFMDVNTGYLVRETDYQKEKTRGYSEYERNDHPGVNIAELNAKIDRYHKDYYKDQEDYRDVLDTFFDYNDNKYYS